MEVYSSLVLESRFHLKGSARVALHTAVEMIDFNPRVGVLKFTDRFYTRDAGSMKQRERERERGRERGDDEMKEAVCS